MDDIPDGFVAIGRTHGPFGTSGEIKMQPLGPESAFAKGKELQIAGQVYTVERYRLDGRLAYLKLAGFNFRDQAEALRDQYITIPETDLEPPGEHQYYHFQLIGLPVVSTEGEPLGEIADILTTAGNEVFVVRGPRGEILVPAIEDIVLSVDLESRLVTIEIVPGLMPD